MSRGYNWNVQILRETKPSGGQAMLQSAEHSAANAPERLLYSVEEAARVWNIGRSSVYAAIQRAQVAFVKLGKSTHIPRSEIERVAREGLSSAEAE